jgi:hypothetical protein
MLTAKKTHRELVRAYTLKALKVICSNPGRTLAVVAFWALTFCRKENGKYCSFTKKEVQNALRALRRQGWAFCGYRFLWSYRDLPNI